MNKEYINELNQSVIIEERIPNTLIQISINHPEKPYLEESMRAIQRVRLEDLEISSSRFFIIGPGDLDYISGHNDEGLPNLIHAWIGDTSTVSDFDTKEYVVDHANRHREMINDLGANI